MAQERSIEASLVPVSQAIAINGLEKLLQFIRFILVHSMKRASQNSAQRAFSRHAARSR